jgi:hypothetical protein
VRGLDPSPKSKARHQVWSPDNRRSATSLIASAQSVESFGFLPFAALTALLGCLEALPRLPQEALLEPVRRGLLDEVGGAIELAQHPARNRLTCARLTLLRGIDETARTRTGRQRRARRTDHRRGRDRARRRGVSVITSVRVCCAGTPTPLCAVISTSYSPMSFSDGVPSIVNVPVANPCGGRLCAWKPGGTPVTVKNIPFPSSGPAGGVGLGSTGAVDRSSE